MATKENASPKKGNVVDAFIAGAKEGMHIAINSTIPNILMAFALIAILNITGLLDIIETVFSPIMGIFGVPGAAAAVLMGAFMSMGGGIGVAAGLLSTGALTVEAVPILLPAIYLMGSQVQYIGRIGGTAGLPSKYTIHMILISIINACLAMWVMNILT